LWAGTLAASAAAALGLTLSTSAPADSERQGPGSPPPAAEIRMVLGDTGPDFRGDDFVVTGQELRITNRTNPQVIGPHFFTLVNPDDIPRGVEENRKCEQNKIICGQLVDAHNIRTNPGFDVRRQLAKAGAPGWDTVFTKDSKGDSWFTQEKNETVVQTVSATGSSTTLKYFCIIHRGMNGKITVNPTR